MKEERDPAHVQRSVNLQFLLAIDETAAAGARARVEAQWGALAGRVMDGALVGTADDAVERIAAYVDAGATGVNVALRAPWPAESLDAWFQDVVPRVRAAG